MCESRVWTALAIASCLTAVGCSSDEPAASQRGRGVGSAGSSVGIGSNPTPGGPVAANGGNALVPLAGGASPGSPVVGGDGNKVCASAIVQTAKNNPTVVFVIDGSGSMCAPFGNGGTRWDAVRK